MYTISVTLHGFQVVAKRPDFWTLSRRSPWVAAQRRAQSRAEAWSNNNEMMRDRPYATRVARAAFSNKEAGVGRRAEEEDPDTDGGPALEAMESNVSSSSVAMRV